MKKFFLNNNKGKILIMPVVLTTMVAATLFNASRLYKTQIPKEEAIYEAFDVDDSDIYYYSALDSKLELIKKEFDKQNLSLDKYYVLTSVSDGISRAVVTCSYDTSFDKAFKESKNNISKMINDKKINPKWVKVDVVNTIDSTITISRLMTNIFMKSNSVFNSGLMFENNGKTIVILEPEINANSIVDYDSGSISLDDLNDYLESRGEERLEKLPNYFQMISTISYFCDENDNVYLVEKANSGALKRKIDELSVEEANKVVRAASDYLVSQMQSNGKFIYGYNATTNIKLIGYNNVRHSGTIWALVNSFDNKAENSKECKEVIDKAIEYLTSIISKKTDDIYHLEYSNGKLALGMDALSLVALSDYTSKFNDTTYLDICKKIGNGIIDMQQEDGHFVHILKDGTFEVQKEFSTVFYDGEAILGLCKLYGISHDEKYLNAAKKAFDYCIDHNYLKYDDHWLEYSANEITKYTDEKKYYTFGLHNLVHGLEKMKNKTSTSHTDFEKLMQGYELYKRIKDNKISLDYLKEFPAEEFLDTLKIRGAYQLNSFCYPEVVMYFEEPQKYLGAFYIRGDNYRIRIDDVQHSMTGFLYYSRNF